MKGDVWIGTKLVRHYYDVMGRKYGYITPEERLRARKRNRKIYFSLLILAAIVGAKSIAARNVVRNLGMKMIVFK